MRVVNIYNGRLLEPGQGGGVRFLTTIVSIQRRAGYDVTVLCVGNGPESPRTVVKDGVEYVEVSSDLKWPSFLGNAALHLLSNRRRYAGSVVHLHRSYFAPVGMIVPHRRVVLTVHTATFEVLASRLKSSKALVRILAWAEGIILNTFVPVGSAVSPNLADLYRKRHGVDFRILPAIVAPDAIALYRHSASRQENSTNGRARPFHVGVVGRLSDVKRPNLALEVFYRSGLWTDAGADLTFVGAGPMLEGLRSQARELGIEQAVRFAGEVRGPEMSGVYERLDVLLLTSRSEGSPYCVREALLCGVPVLATDVGDVRRWVTAGSGKIMAFDCADGARLLRRVASKEHDRSAISREAEGRACEDVDAFESVLACLYAERESIRGSE